MPFFSIIMPAYNASKYICEAINSVLAQSFKNWELLIINDGSTDNTLELVQQYRADNRIKIINQSNKGLGGSRNTGLLNAEGSWITFLDSDDLWTENKLLVQYQTIQNEPNIDVICSNGYSFFEDKPLPIYYHFDVLEGFHQGKDVYPRIFLQNLIPVLSVAVKKEWVDKIGLQDISVTTGSEDWDYWIRLAKNGANFIGLKERLFIYRVHASGMSANQLKQRRSSYEIQIKNLDTTLLPQSTINNWVKAQIPLFCLTKTDKSQADSLGKTLNNYYRPSSPLENLLQRILPFSYFLLMLAPKENILKQITKWGGKIIYKTLTTILFSTKKFVGQRANLFNAHFHRWRYKKQLIKKGFFFMHKNAAINITATMASFETYGLSIFEYSQINLGRDDSYFFTGSDVVINRYCNFNIWSGKLLIGNNVSFNNYCSINCMKEIQIGHNTWFGEGVRFYDHNHRFKQANIPFTDQGFTTGKISIGNNCWVGSNCVILQNVTIGDNCVIGANNLIYKSVPANTIIKAKAMEVVSPLERIPS